MQFKVNDGKVPYIMVAGSDYVSGEMPVETAESIYAAGEPKSSDQFKGYPICVDNKYFFACQPSTKTSKRKKSCGSCFPFSVFPLSSACWQALS